MCISSILFSVQAKPNKNARQIKKVNRVLAGYIKQYAPLIEVKTAAKKIEFKEKTHTSILQSKPVSQKAFIKAFPQTAGLKGSLAQYLASKGFKRIKECLSFDPNSDLSGAMWKKGGVKINYIFSYTTNPKTYDQLDQISFFTKDICGKN
jgi:hypothetical protein